MNLMSAVLLEPIKKQYKRIRVLDFKIQRIILAILWLFKQYLRLLIYVKNYQSKRDDIQGKFKPRGSNSFVPPGANFEFEIGIMVALTRDGGEGVRYAMVAIGIFY